jgi:cytochrome c-type biogenesis protein
MPWQWLLALGIVALAVAGYAGYVVYPRFDLPAVEGITLLILAAGAGIASFFSPCAFPLLVTLLARQTGVEAQQTSGRQLIGRGLVFASALSVGAATFLLIGGLVIAAGGAALFAGVTFDSPAGRIIRIIVGVVLIVLGLMQVGVLPNYFHNLERLVRPWARWQASYRRQASPVLGFAVFGFGYLLAGFGWTGPILAGLAGHAFITGGLGTALAAFVAAAIVIVTLMFTLATGIAIAQEKAVATVQAGVAQVRRWGGWVLMVVGGWLIILAIFADFFAGVFPV